MPCRKSKVIWEIGGHTLPDAQSHARQGHCVAIQLGVLRHPGDLTPPPGDELIGELAAFDEPDDGILLGMPTFDEPEPPPPRRPWWKFW
ncbi:MAG: hypothetical protein FJ304_14715 [Planctomycetes bacterium]|nr:hypothetical protein [Planctomycetota bacterium]